MKAMTALLSSLVGISVTAGEVKFAEDTITLPTYAPGGYDKTPLFYTGRVYQGAQGRVYPYPMQDVLHDDKYDETYKYLTLENEWLQMGLLPEHGGHLLNFTDKATGFETFYRQHVVKPALIGMLGAWISGGVEWNFPHHHRATTAMPIDWRMTERDPKEPDDFAPAAGTKTIWIGETELRRRLKWTIGLSMMPDRAVLMAENVFMNRQPTIESMIYWANVSVHCGDDYQILFPPSCHLGFDHHKNYWTSWPIGPRKEEVELLPSQRSKYADDISGLMDLSWWRNYTIESRSIFAMDPDNNWLAGMDHKRNIGTAHVSNRHITVGKKFFLWGNFPEAHVWDTVLTDHDGPYLELMVGCWSDNQPDYSWIAPYETRRVKQFWFPVKGIGGVKNVTVDGAVNVDRRGKEELLVGFHSTRALKDCTVTLFRGREPVVVEKGVAIDPNTPWCRVLKVAADAADQEFTAAIADAAGKVFLSYTPVGPDPHDPLPPKVENPKEPKEYTSAELAYEVGLRLDQFHNGILDPEPYYNRALELDPDYTRANLAMGLRRLKNGMYAEAKPYLEKAVKRATQNHTRALDAEPEYYLALCCLGLGEEKRAEDLFWRCTWRASVKKEALFELVRLCCRDGRYREAHDLLEFQLLQLAAGEAKVHTLHAYIHRQLGDCPDAVAAHRANWKAFAAKWQREAFRCDPLEYWGECEETFREGGDGAAALAKAEKNRGLKAQQLMECVADYFGIGAWDEVLALCEAALAKAKTERSYRTEGALPLSETLAACDSYRSPMFGYFRAYAMARLSKSADEVSKALTEAGMMSTDYCFPSRLEELAVLKWAADGQSYGDKAALANTHYYLAEILWNMDQKDAAKASWQSAVALNPKHALALRCLGFAIAHPGTYFTNTGVPSGIASREAYDYYIRSLEADPENFRTLDEAGKLAEKLKLPARELLALMLKYRTATDKYDPCILRLAYCYNAVGEYAKAHEILTTRRFHVWEGADGLLAPFVESCVGLGRQAMEAKDYGKALKYFEESTTYPSNLQAGRPGDAGTEPKSRYFMAQCKKALGDEAGYKAELENSLKGWIHAGEMDYWRVKALRELGRGNECAALVAELKQAIAEMESPQPTVINAYAKFAGENSAMERAAKAREQADFLRGLLKEIER